MFDYELHTQALWQWTLPLYWVEGGPKNPWRIGIGNLPLEENLKNHKALKRLLINVFVKNKINYN